MVRGHQRFATRAGSVCTFGLNREALLAQDECFVLTVPDPTGEEPQGVFPHKDSPLVRDLMLLLEYDASPECAPANH